MSSMTTAFVLVDVDPSRIEELATAIADVEGVESVWSVTGADADLVVLVQVPAVDDVATVVTHHIARLEGIRKTRTAVAFREYSSRELDAAFEDFGD
jgi:DNA-binding Lrp family transcriptional regulator